MLDKNVVGLDWSTFFIDENGKERNKEQLLFQLKFCKNAEEYYNRGICCIKVKGFDGCDEESLLAIERVLYKFLVQDTTFALDVLTEEEYFKVQELVLRKQFNSKLLKQLNGKFSYLLLGERDNKFGEILMLDVVREKSLICEEKANKSFAELKPVVDKITSGIKSVCYLEAEGTSFILDGIRFDLKSNEYIKEKFLYDFNSNVESKSLFLWDYEGIWLNEFFKSKLFLNEKFWEKHSNFSITAFIEAVRKHNTDTQANKILTYLFEQICKDDFAKKLIENNLSLIYLNKKTYLKELQVRTYRFSFGRFGINQRFDDLFYPLSNIENIEKKLEKGKEIFEKCLYDEIYVHAKNDVKTFIHNEILNPKPILKDQKWTLIDMLDSFTFGFFKDREDRKVIELFDADCFTVESILNRAYIKSYYLSTIAKDEKDLAYKFFDVFYDLTQVIEKRIGIQTTYQKDKVIRETAFEELKEALSKYDIKINDKYKNEYIISLLDRKVACFEEAEKFPVLEQLGDAIYGFAVAELLFYNPVYQESDCDYYKLHQSYIVADKQVEICKKIGIDKLYLKASSVAHKYEYDKLIDADTESFSMEQVTESYSVKEKYLADSLEMIIGTICKDFGIKQALDFTKTIIIETFPKVFRKEIRDDDKQLFSEFFLSLDDKLNHVGIERDYLNKILPALYGAMEKGHIMINDALVKLTLALCLETDSVDARNYITRNFGDSVVKDEYAKSMDISRFLHDYFYNGLDFVVEKYKEKIINNYKNK